jgi:hypothetical protein
LPLAMSHARILCDDPLATHVPSGLNARQSIMLPSPWRMSSEPVAASQR